MQASPDDIDVSALMSSVRRGLPRLLAITGLAGALTYGTLMLVPASYKSTAQIILQSSSSSLLRPSGEVGTGNDLKIDEIVLKEKQLPQQVEPAEANGNDQSGNRESFGEAPSR